MFKRLFAESGLSLERLRSLVEVGAAGSIVQAAAGDPVRQSQYSRQVKELEDFFQVNLVERHGKGIRLTPSGRELARISRFFLMGLSNFQRGCLAEEHVYRLGGSGTVLEVFAVPLLARPGRLPVGRRFCLETAAENEIERRLHDLTLDFGIVTRPALSRPLQLRKLGSWRVQLWVPASLAGSPAAALRALRARRLPLAWPVLEAPQAAHVLPTGLEPHLLCGTFLEARTALEQGGLAAFLPAFLKPANADGRLLPVRVPEAAAARYDYHLAWNPRLLRLNPHAARCREFLAAALRFSVLKGG